MALLPSLLTFTQHMLPRLGTLRYQSATLPPPSVLCRQLSGMHRVLSCSACQDACNQYLYLHTISSIFKGSVLDEISCMELGLAGVQQKLASV